uniref:Uncharacterized protein n=1 Tax=Pseudomonas fluorescens (strain SBW25) TaxID=216595 RepID=A0A0G4E573_PSEFS|nr:hypothetical protein PQBR57_0422 [Pseudomonas fluorescens SBW25]
MNALTLFTNAVDGRVIPLERINDKCAHASAYLGLIQR